MDPTRYERVFAGLFAASEPLEPRERVRVELVAEVAARAVYVLGPCELAEEHSRRELPHLGARRAPHGLVGGDDRDLLAAAVLRGEPLDHRVRIRGPADCERAELLVLPAPVEDEHTARALACHPAREQVAQL